MKQAESATMRVMSFLRGRPRSTIAEINDALGINQKTVESAVYRLLKAGLIHHPSHRRTPHGGKAKREYCIGAGPNESRPLASEWAKNDKRRQRQKERRAARALKKRMEQGGPFAVIINQLVRK